MLRVQTDDWLLASLSRDKQPADSVTTRARTQSVVTPGRRERRVSHLSRARLVSQTSLGARRRRESRHSMNSAPTAGLINDEAVKEINETKENGLLFNKVIILCLDK